MSSKKTNYPYYATWWFFIGLLFLGWMTPITSNWELYLSGKKVKGKLVNIRNENGRVLRKYAFIYKGHPYFSEFEEGNHGYTLPLIVDLYLNSEDPSNNFISETDFMYVGNGLIFPVILQMLMVPFFIMVRAKEYRD